MLKNDSKENNNSLIPFLEFRDNYNRQYFLAHRDKTNCSCGGIYTYDHKARHFKSQRHMKFIVQ